MDSCVNLEASPSKGCSPPKKGRRPILRMGDKEPICVYMFKSYWSSYEGVMRPITYRRDILAAGITAEELEYIRISVSREWATKKKPHPAMNIAATLIAFVVCVSAVAIPHVGQGGRPSTLPENYTLMIILS
jgi:hypothetical protein